jgi:hypothetical protein
VVAVVLVVSAVLVAEVLAAAAPAVTGKAIIYNIM